MQIAADITINNSTFQHNQIMKLSNNSLKSYTELKTFHHNIKNWFQIPPEPDNRIIISKSRIKPEYFKTLILWDVPGFGLGNSDDHTLKLRSEDDLASEPGVLVENPSPRVPLEHVLFVVGPWRELFEPFLRDIDLAFGRAGVDILEPVGGRVDQAALG